MRVARVKWILWLTAAAAAGGAIAAWLAAALLPLNAPTTPAAQLSRSTSATTTPATLASPLPPLDTFATAWQLPLRRPLIDPPPATTEQTAATTKPPAPPIRLIGTIVDTHHPRGIFMTGLAKIELKGVGETTAGAKVLAVDQNSATLSYDGQTLTLRRERTPFDPTGDAYESAAAATPPTPAATTTQKGEGG